MLSLSIALSVVFCMAYFSEYFAIADGNFYLNLIKPISFDVNIFFNTIIPLVYVIYITSIAISVYHRETRKTLSLWIVIATLNIAWCAFFFRFKLVYLAQELVILILILMVYLEYLYARKNLKLSILILPIILCYALAVALSFGIIKIV